MGILSMSLASSVLIIVIVVIRILLINRLPKKTFLVLWGIALCRLLIPLSVPSKLNIFALLHLNNSKVIGTTALVIPSNGVKAVPDMGNPILTDSSTTGISTVTLFWLIGLIGCTLYILVTHLKCCREYKTALPVDNDFVRCWLKEHKLRRIVQIRQYDRIAAPLTYGIIKPVILLPKTTEWADEKRLEYILTHEYVHIKRFDTMIKVLLAATLCIHWFNPLVWVMYILANRDIETSCDESVIRTFGETAKHAYAMALIELEEKKSSLTPLCSGFSKNSTQERIVTIMKMKKTSLLGIVLAITVVIGTTAAFATSASTGGSEITGAIKTASTVNTDGNSTTSKIALEDLSISKTNISYDDFKTWLEKQKTYLKQLVDSGEWSQDSVNKELARYQKVLNSIKNGDHVDIMVDKTGKTESIIVIPPSDFNISIDGSKDIITIK